MKRLTQKDKDGNYVEAKDLEHHCMSKDKRGYATYRGQHIDKLAEYEDLEEQKRLLKLPCGIGADVYYIPSKVNFDLNILNQREENNKVHHQNVTNIVYTKHGWFLECDKDLEYGTGGIFLDKMFGETWFLSEEDAGNKLKEWKSNALS